ncbi:unnamed protein product [Nippostrongylus brasiliensis]|uniref:Homeobox protein cut-like n=1 Tax=Nippostrongylus brasiliensis TaxID=27835 RepID=A0A158R0C8_NIPBR|nr:unnamed protein product [Nippostrongylus brasiliensis]
MMDLLDLPESLEIRLVGTDRFRIDRRPAAGRTELPTSTGSMNENELEPIAVRPSVHPFVSFVRPAIRVHHPTPIIEQAIIWKSQAEKTNIAVEESSHLRAQIAQVQTELADLKNQDVTIRQLRDTIKQLEEEKTKEVSELESMMRDAQRRLDTARVAADRKEALENEQIDILTRDLNDAHRRVSYLEAEVGRLTNELADARASSQRGGLEDIAALGGLMKEKDEQIARLTEENQRLVEAVSAETKKARAQCAELTTELGKKNQRIQQLEVLLADQSDYEAIKKELRLLREIEFGDAASANEESIARLGETVQSLDRLLAAKNRRLQNDNALLRQSNERYQGDDIMQAILAGSHQTVVEAVSTRIGREVAEGFVDSGDIEQIRRLSKNDAHEAERSKPNADDQQNLFKILMNGSSHADGARSPSSDIPFEHFRYSPKLTNYTGEPAKTPQELKAIQDLQSQGSLSELLSKPRHWSKLTDKGREAFRRIYGWISDAEAVDLLCSLSPRRVWPSEVRIEHPTPESLWEGNSGLLPPDEPDENTFKRAATKTLVAPAAPYKGYGRTSYRLAGTNQAANAGTTTRNSRWRHDDIPKEKIMSIFQTELAKLREQESTLERAIATRSFGSGHVRRVMTTRMRAGLSAITQEQFEMFGHIDTEEVVRQIKEFLLINSISQRQFGEHVLGLSQGSVSDLLARPKQWNMLTQKGREPFIRMKLFMSEVLQSNKSSEKASADNAEAPSSKSDDCVSDSASVSTVKVKREIPDDEDLVAAGAIPRSEFDSMSATSADEAESGTDCDEVDTAMLVRKVKDRLHLHGISQRLFGEMVLGISAGGCSELFLRPRRWSSLSVKGREPYEKMKTWLADKESVQRLLARERRTIITEQQKEALRFVFQHEHHPSQKTVELLSLKLNLNIRTVNNWFHNHRTRQKASLKEGKVYTPAVGSIPSSKNWQQDLHVILENASRFALLEEAPPTMVPVVSKPLFSESPERSSNSSVLIPSSTDERSSAPSSASPLFSTEENELARNDFELTQLRQQSVAQQELVAKLEADLAAAVAGRNTSNVEDLSTVDMLGAVHNVKQSDDDNSVLTIVLAQRDRLKLRVGVLEEELMTEKTKQTMLQTEIDKVRDDNVKLYGKIKFLQGYGSKSPETTVLLPEENNYSQQYERRLDPFQRFGQAETQRSYSRLPMHDRASLSIGRAIMTSASARMTFFFYLIVLHLLVFLLTCFLLVFMKDCGEGNMIDVASSVTQPLSRSLNADASMTHKSSATYLLHSNVRIFTNAIAALSKLGDELFLRAMPRGISLKAFNKNRSAYAVFLFVDDFFSDYDTSCCHRESVMDCRISMKHTYDVTRHFDVNVMEKHKPFTSDVNKSDLKNAVTINASEIAAFLSEMHSGYEELMMSARDDKFVFTNFVPLQAGEIVVLKTHLFT